MEANIYRSFLSTVLLIGCISIPSIATPHAPVPEVKQHGSAEDMPPGQREPVSAAREREARSIYAADSTGLGETSRVPAEARTIQIAIFDAEPFDTIIVAPIGTLRRSRTTGR